MHVLKTPTVFQHQTDKDLMITFVPDSELA